MKDFYYILGLERNTSLDAIKKAHKLLALKFHPDLNKGDKFFEQRFKDIQEAYETLSDTDKRKQYDAAFKFTQNGGNTYDKTREEELKKQKEAFEKQKNQQRENDRIREEELRKQKEDLEKQKRDFEKKQNEKRESESKYTPPPPPTAPIVRSNNFVFFIILGVIAISAISIMMTLNNKNPNSGSYINSTHDESANTRNATNTEIPVTAASREVANSSSPIEPEMVNVEGGTFQMGGDHYDNEKPIHPVTVSSFNIGKYEVTQAQWKAVMGSNPSEFKGDNLPVEQVSWNDIQAYLDKLNNKIGGHYRLPTEAEWEFAARGGNKSNGYEFSGSNKANSVAWTEENSGNKTHPIGQKQANELGSYDMSGNVWEWCSDWYDKDYENIPSQNPKGASSGSGRVLRGGGWTKGATYSRVADRLDDAPSFRHNTLGFRVALTFH